MICKNCGKELPEGTTLCPDCDIQASDTETSVVTDNAVDENTVSEIEEFAQPSFDDQPPKRKKGKLIAIISAAVVVLLAVLIGFNFSFVQGLFIKTFCSEETYFKYVEKKALAELTDTGAVLYGDVTENFDVGNIGSEVKVDLKLGDKLLSLIEENAGTEADLDWLKNMSYTVKANADGKNLDYGIKFNIGEGTLFDIRALFNMDKQDVYLGILNLSDKYIKTSGATDTTADTTASFTISPEMKNALPSEQEANELLDKYLDIALGSLGNVTKTSDKIEVGEYTQGVTVLKYELSEKDVMKVAKNVLKELKSDEDIKAYIADVEGVMLEEYAELLEENDYEKGDMYAEFKQAIESALDSINATEADNTEILVLVDYVNAKHEIIGREIEIDGKTVVSYVSAHKGSKFAFKAESEELGLEITGEGTDKNDIISGKYQVKVDYEKMLEFELTDFNVAELKDGKINGSITVTPSSNLISQLFDTDATTNTVISMLEPSVKISFESGEKSATVDISVLSKDENLLSVVMTSAVSGGGEITLPAEASVMDSTQVVEWADSLDLTKLVDALKAAKLPEDMLDTVELYINAIKEAGGLGTVIESSTNDDYYYDDSYDYDYDYDYGYSYDTDYIY